ncbi:MAG: DJ-1/PfpI family protein [Bacillota bacterium]|nr:DJ-1/PfpI family protein [Bacillota bacterium]
MIYVHLADGFEEVEALTVVDVLRRADLKVQTVSITGEKTVKGTHGICVEADILYEETDYPSCEMIVLPGGMPGAANLQQHEGLADHIKCFAKDIEKGGSKRLAAICAAPMVLGSCGVFHGRKATIYPGMENQLQGAEVSPDNVVSDGGIITGKGPAYAMEFALKLAEELAGKVKADEVAEGLLYRR